MSTIFIILLAINTFLGKKVSTYFKKIRQPVEYKRSIIFLNQHILLLVLRFIYRNYIKKTLIFISIPVEKITSSRVLL